MAIDRFMLDRLLKWGTPWHGKRLGNIIYLPGGATMAAPGQNVYGGDFIKVQVPDQPAAITEAEEAAEGKTWLNYGIVSGKNHLFYGKELGARSWLYVAPDKSIWLVNVDFPGATAAITFKRFGRIGEAPAAAIQTEYFTPNWTTVQSLDVVQDITPGGDKILWSHRNSSVSASGSASRKCETMLEGVSLLTISGTPPSATISWTIEKTSAQCAGALSNTMQTTITAYYSIGQLWPTDTNYILSSTIETLSTSVAYATDGQPAPVPEPTIPGDYDFVGTNIGTLNYRSTFAQNTDASTFISDITGSKSITGAIIGARFSVYGSPAYITIDTTLGDSFSTTYHVISGVFEPVVIVDYSAYSRTGSLIIKNSGTPFIDVPLAAEYTAETVSANWSCLTLNVNLGGLFEDTDPGNYNHYFGSLSPMNIESDGTHIVVTTGGPVGGHRCQRLMPARYANQCYGLLRVIGNSDWALTPSWTDSSGNISEHHKAFSASGASSVEATWSGISSGTSGSQQCFASSNPVDDAVAISLTDNVCFV